ncbi:hypothetical protein [Arthrobacter sp. IK3]|uniref:hypothetical protein n=1 Tax=Arthrobacter sp. IK3 TaxID=3448169 RepID=UPI003EE3CFCD
MKSILTQDEWDRLPVNTYARLTASGPEGYTDTYVTRVYRETGPAEGEHLSLGGQAWRDAFQKSDITYALYIPPASKDTDD